MPPFTLALAQYPLEPLASLSAWKDKIATWVSEASAVGAKLLVFPEYAAMELTSLDPRGAGDPAAAIRYVAALRQTIDAHHAVLAARHGVHIVAGSMPVPLEDGRIVNRARIFAPSRGMSWQDKIVPTQTERAQWGISGGDVIRAFRTPVGVVGIAIGCDIGYPMVARAQAEAGARLILVPTRLETAQAEGHARIGALARALENQLFVAQAPLIGDGAHGAAGLFGMDGAIGTGPAGEGRWLLLDVDPEQVVDWRQDGAADGFASWPEQAGLAFGPAPKVPCELVNFA